MCEEKFVNYIELGDGSLYLYAGGRIDTSEKTLYWPDFVTALKTFGTRNEKLSLSATSSDGMIEGVERRYNVTASYALSQLYGREMPHAMNWEIVGRVISFNHKLRIPSVVTMGIVTASFTRSHRAFTSHVSYSEKGMVGYFNTGSNLLRRLSSDINGLDLTIDERFFLRSFYQNLLANY